MLKTVAGTPMFMAPEVVKGNPYNSKIDCWAMGVLLYLFMSGYLPFQGNSNMIKDKIINGKYHFEHVEFSQCSLLVIDLIKKLLTVNPNLRISAKQALNHEWFKATKIDAQQQPIQIRKNVIERLLNFRGTSLLKKAALNWLVKMTDQKEIDSLREQFQKIDTDNSGVISLEELK